MKKTPIPSFLYIAGLLAVATAPTAVGSATVQSDDSCALSVPDKAWVDQAVAAWRYTRQNLVKTPAIPRTSAIFFSEDCMISSSDALFSSGAPTWTSQTISEYVPLPYNYRNPITVVSRAQNIGDQSIFLMAAPSLWRETNVTAGENFPLETLMTAIMIHEATHVAHGDTYMAQSQELAERLNLPESWNDDSIQYRFRSNSVIANSVARETELLYSAAAASSDAEAYRLASEASELMSARRAKFYRGADRNLDAIEDVFLTIEGAGQWAGYIWLINRAGGNVSPSAAISQFGRRVNFWSQTQGLAITMATHRLDGGAWQSTVFGDGSLAGLELLDQALAQYRKSRPRP